MLDAASKLAVSQFNLLTDVAINCIHCNRAAMLNMIFNDIMSAKVNTVVCWSHRGPLEQNLEPVDVSF